MRHPSNIRILLFTLLTFVGGCMIVEDFGTYWDQGIVDPNLEGSWQSPNGECMQYIKINDHYTMQNENLTIKTLPLKNSTYMMMKENESHFLYKYSISDQKLTLYTPDKSQREAYQEQYSNQSIVLNDYTVTITTLDASVIDLLEKIGNQPEFWKKESVSVKQAEACPIAP